MGLLSVVWNTCDVVKGSAAQHMYLAIITAYYSLYCRDEAAGLTAIVAELNTSSRWRIPKIMRDRNGFRVTSRAVGCIFVCFSVFG
jgi:hypothetical protein